MTWLAIAAGGALGSLARHAVNQFVQPATRFPFGITVVNVAGCFVVGALAGLIASSRLVLSNTGREFIFIGILGGFTTFSAFGLDTVVLARSSVGLAIVNVVTQVGGGLTAVWFGYALGSAGR